MRKAFVLTREHTHEALLKMEAVQRTWEFLADRLDGIRVRPKARGED